MNDNPCEASANQNGKATASRDRVRDALEQLMAAGPPRLRTAEWDTTLQELGLSSLEQMELIGRIERTLAIRIPDQDLWSLETCGDLAESVARQLEARDG